MFHLLYQVQPPLSLLNSYKHLQLSGTWSVWLSIWVPYQLNRMGVRQHWHLPAATQGLMQPTLHLHNTTNTFSKMKMLPYLLSEQGSKSALIVSVVYWAISINSDVTPYENPIDTIRCNLTWQCSARFHQIVSLQANQWHKFCCHPMLCDC